MLSKQDLSLNELMVFTSEMRGAEKSTATAYLMLIGGHLGLHRFYLKRKGTAIAQLILFAAAAIFYFIMAVASEIGSELFAIFSIIMFVLPALALFIWIMVDLFLLPRMIREFNEVIEREILDQIEHFRRMEQLAGRGRPDEPQTI
jgi:TM2 domain-containing membrane protein YozV